MILETERLILRKPIEDDLDLDAEFFASDRSKYVGGPLSRELTWRLMATLLGHWELRGYGFFAVVEKSTNTYVGRVGPWFPEGWPEPEIGWTVMEHGEGKGYAFEAASEVLRYVYQDLGWTTATSMIDADNLRSKALAERLGAKYDYDFNHERFGTVNIWRHQGPEAFA